MEPTIIAPMHPKEIYREQRSFLALPQDFSTSPFFPLTPEECLTDWGKEYRIALTFAADFDLFRAITGFKRALCLLPVDSPRRTEIEYCITLSYYLGKKYIEAVHTVRSSTLACVDPTFAAYQDLLLILYDSYTQLNEELAANQVLNLLENGSPEQAHQLTLLQAIRLADIPLLRQEAETHPEHVYINSILNGYLKEKKSIKQAEMLNAILPGAGYYYVGLKNSAITSFLLNALFIGATVHFFDQGQIAAGIITLTFESGWYFGGIYGAGLAAKKYNEQLYCKFVDKIFQRETLFPLFMIKYSF